MSDDEELVLELPRESARGRSRRAGDMAYWIFWCALVGFASALSARLSAPNSDVSTTICVVGWLLGIAQYCTTHRGEHGGVENAIVAGFVEIPLIGAGSVLGFIVLSL